MANMLEEGAIWLSGQLEDHCSSTVTYRRGAASVVVPAVKGSTTFQKNDFETVEKVYTSADYIIEAADLILSGNPVVPEAGDVILDTVDGVTFHQQVSSPPSEPEWRWADEHRQRYRIHTKKIRET